LATLKNIPNNKYFVIWEMANKTAKAKVPTTKKIKFPNDKPVHLDISFQDAIKLALNTPVKNSKINKK